MKKYSAGQVDVAVIGAGPAGSTFAHFLALSKPEARIAIIDGQTRERSKVCGGDLGRGRRGWVSCVKSGCG